MKKPNNSSWMIVGHSATAVNRFLCNNQNATRKPLRTRLLKPASALAVETSPITLINSQKGEEKAHACEIAAKHPKVT
jgi:hypothetical protein